MILAATFTSGQTSGVHPTCAITIGCVCTHVDHAKSVSYTGQKLLESPG